MTSKIVCFLITSAVESILNILQYYCLHFSSNLHKIRYGWYAQFIKNFIKICTIKAIVWSGGNRCNRSAHNALKSYCKFLENGQTFLRCINEIPLCIPLKPYDIRKATNAFVKMAFWITFAFLFTLHKLPLILLNTLILDYIQNKRKIFQLFSAVILKTWLNQSNIKQYLQKINHRQVYISAVTTWAMDLALKKYFNKLKHFMSVAHLS